MVYGPLEIVVYNGIICKWSLLQYFIDAKICISIRRATEEEKIRHAKRP